MAKQETNFLGDEYKALLALLKAGFKVTLYKQIDKLHSIERVYTPDSFSLLIDHDKIRGQDAADEAKEIEREKDLTEKRGQI